MNESYLLKAAIDGMLYINSLALSEQAKDTLVTAISAPSVLYTTADGRILITDTYSINVNLNELVIDGSPVGGNFVEIPQVPEFVPFLEMVVNSGAGIDEYQENTGIMFTKLNVRDFTELNSQTRQFLQRSYVEIKPYIDYLKPTRADVMEKKQLPTALVDDVNTTAKILNLLKSDPITSMHGSFDGALLLIHASGVTTKLPREYVSPFYAELNKSVDRHEELITRINSFFTGDYDTRSETLTDVINHIIKSYDYDKLIEKHISENTVVLKKYFGESIKPIQRLIDRISQTTDQQFVDVREEIYSSLKIVTDEFAETKEIILSREDIHKMIRDDITESIDALNVPALTETFSSEVESLKQKTAGLGSEIKKLSSKLLAEAAALNKHRELTEQAIGEAQIVPTAISDIKIKDNAIYIIQYDGSEKFVGRISQTGYGVAGMDGAPGLSAYQIAVKNGFVGTEADWLNSLGGSNSTYTNTTPTTATVGGIESGSTFSSVPVSTMFDMLLYPLQVTLSATPAAVEKGTTLTSISLNFSANGATSKTLDNGIGAVLASPYIHSTSASSDVTYTLTAVKGTTTKTASATVKFMNKVYYGVSSTLSGTSTDGDWASALLASSANFSAVKKLDTTYTTTGQQRFFYAYPVAFGAIGVVKVSGFSFTSFTTKTISLTNAAGHTENYYVLFSNNTFNNSTILVNWGA